ncbi:hypothetical protein JOB18_040655 [Solea senegalensis]|uniref:Uncharacterized protein n=1 Tax=Solea senegalensis TaxID=28829 RepID=A0AAV6RMH0_SOLSE|nr:hypothetical protein JOB18_040655 [Solea senegalensis]
MKDDVDEAPLEHKRRAKGRETCSSLAKRLGDLEEKQSWTTPTLTRNTCTQGICACASALKTPNLCRTEPNISCERSQFCMSQADSVKPRGCGP